MKPLYSTPIAFKPMKEPTANCPWCEGKGYEWVECGELSGYDYREPCRCVLRRIPYLVGEKCYVREAWKVDRIEDDLVIRYKSDNAVICIHESNDSDVLALIDHKLNPWSWRSPVTMPQWAARRFVTVLSCEPVRVEDVTEEDCVKMGVDSSKYGKTYRFAFLFDWEKRHPGKEWAWRVESEEEK